MLERTVYVELVPEDLINYQSGRFLRSPQCLAQIRAFVTVVLNNLHFNTYQAKILGQVLLTCIYIVCM